MPEADLPDNVEPAPDLADVPIRAEHTPPPGSVDETSKSPPTDDLTLPTE